MDTKKILIISDTHGSVKNLQRILTETNKKYDRLFHLGDNEGDEEKIRSIMGVPCDMVRGNCDYFTHLSDTLTIKIGNHNCMLTHGHLFNAKRDTKGLIMVAKDIGADYVFFGHTHKPLIMTEDGITLVNPGSLSLPYGGDRPTYIEMDITSEGEIQLSLERL